jgi:hypothetical protein
MKAVCYGGIFVLARLFFFAWGAFQQLDSVVWYTITYGVSTAFLGALVIAILSGSSAQGLNKEFPLQFRLAAQFRTPILMFIVVPLSYFRWLHTVIMDFWRERFAEKVKSTHSERVESIQKQVSAWNAAGRKSKLRTARPNWASMSTKLSSNKGDSSLIKCYDLNHILDVDFKNMTVRFFKIPNFEIYSAICVKLSDHL